MKYTARYSEGLGSNCCWANDRQAPYQGGPGKQSGKHPDMDDAASPCTRYYGCVASTCATSEWRSHIYGGEDPTLVMGVEKGVTWVRMYLFETLHHGDPKAQKPPDRP
ncbi:hypothetical protein SNK03_13607 [Fusarium graminearum]|uniref:Chromosome 2, complete genome n=1 Tax=Gibberella zeae (strain ATCC MYA-4620 / CBS 123657 / FGSC 9075 / NRRL 31084 / PH-1) TaxID=229533 RepID=I1S623_GIBZE|nr:hypothetical protein FGSG_12294 [Fusarium graminearum PH-1]ESU08947.1 hypothetical protein FGSG_12294 [Fusarium graminearum PH-1]CEF79143.1 unnamed protein product [Fusarium graminearum]|eukprot:XP_011321446.1 hypothetical protein FGSG_12294 [Fusarium graminearum PH-1]